MIDEHTLKSFSAINNFVNSLDELYGEDHHPLRQYQFVLGKTTLNHHKVIDKHLTAFREFSQNNRQEILQKDSNFVDSKILYPHIGKTSVYIDMNEIFKLVEKESSKDRENIKNTIWKHLLTISAFVDPVAKATEVLRRETEKIREDVSAESDLLSNIISQAETMAETMTEGEGEGGVPDPSKMMGMLQSSGIMGDVLGKLTTGEVDISKLMGMTLNMAQTLGKEIAEIHPEDADKMTPAFDELKIAQDRYDLMKKNGESSEEQDVLNAVLNSSQNVCSIIDREVKENPVESVQNSSMVPVSESSPEPETPMADVD